MDLLLEINDLIHLEVVKAVKKQKENFDSALHELQKRVIKLEHDHDDLEQYGRPLWSKKTKQQIKFSVKLRTF